MQTFKDKNGREWKIELPYGTIVRVKRESDGKYNLSDPAKDDLGDRILGIDLESFWEVLAHVCRPQFAPSGVTAEDFGDLMAGDCLVRAQRAFYEEWRDFFRQIQRNDFVAALEAIWAIREAALRAMNRKLAQDETLASLPGRVESKANQMLTNAFRDLRASLESILTDTPGDSSGSETKASCVSSAG